MNANITPDSEKSPITTLPDMPAAGNKSSLKVLTAGSILFATASSLFGQITNITVNKGIFYDQTSASTVVLNSNPYGFGTDVDGVNIQSIAPPTVAPPPGGTASPFYNTLSYDGNDANFSHQWAYGPPGSDDWGSTSLADINSLFPNGVYKFTVHGTTIPLNLSGNAYPNTPLATLSGGSWSGSQYVINAGNALTITTNIFSGYGSNVDGSVLIASLLNGAARPTFYAQVYHHSSPSSDFLSYTLPADTLIPGESSSFGIGFDAIVDENTIGGTLNTADYTKDTFIQISAIPEPSTYAAILGVAALGFAIVRRKRMTV